MSKLKNYLNHFILIINYTINKVNISKIKKDL